MTSLFARMETMVPVSSLGSGILSRMKDTRPRTLLIGPRALSVTSPMVEKTFSAATFLVVMVKSAKDMEKAAIVYMVN